MCPKEELIPGGIPEPVTGKSFLFFGTSYKTSDFIVDGLLLWWEGRRHELCGLKNLVINAGNGPEYSGRRTQFLLRLTEFADMTGLSVRIIYYPPYHSKYNAIERYWAGLEKSWNGYHSPNSSKTSWKFLLEALRAVTRLLDAPYAKGIRVCGDEKLDIEKRLQRSSALQWWDIIILPKTVSL